MMKFKTRYVLLCLLLATLPALADEVPAVLPDPDGKAGDATKPVKVYILAGQSNMVGMGNISGATNIYTGVYFTSDPAVNEGAFQIYKVGNFKVSHLATYSPDGEPAEKPIAQGLLEVPQNGAYQFHCGHGGTSYATMVVDGKQVYRRAPKGTPAKEAISLTAGKKYPFKITGFENQPPHFWLEKTDLLGNGDLEAVARREGKFPWLVDDTGEWTVRRDVYFQEARLAKDGKGSLLTATSNGKTIGPELGFGHVMGQFHDEQVLLIKTAQGNRSLGFDFRPPSSGRTDPDSEFESAEYRLMVEGVRKTLDNIENVVPGYKGQGYEIAGLVWFQGHKDSFAEQSIAEYEKHLVNLIKDVREEFKSPKLPVAVATVGFGGHDMQEKFVRILKSQLAVGDAEKHPDFKGTVASVDTRDFWREVDQSPKGEDYHYNRNAETYLLIGDALGRAMVRLHGGTAQPLPLTPGPKRKPQPTAAELTEAEKGAAQRALRPIIIDGIAASYVNNPRYQKALLEEASGQRPQRANQFLRGSMFGLVNCYQASGVTEYNWRQFGPDLNKVQWQYYSFDPKEALPKDKGNRFREVTYPDGMENWFGTDFNPGKAGWKTGLQPFGQLDGKLAPLSETCTAPFCRCGEVPKTLWEKEVLLVRGEVELPEIKPGHRYRVVVGGAAHVNSGEGFALYANGKLLGQSKAGVAVRQGGQPRGAYIYNDVRDEIKGGKVTIAAITFLRYNHPRHGPQPPRGHFSLQIEEQKLPPIEPAAEGGAK